MEPSVYQKNVYYHLGNYAGHSAVISVAGSGKTFTAIEGIGHIPAFYSVLLGAFNVTIRDEFKNRGQAKGYKNVRYFNFNGFGWGIALKHQAPELDKEKTRHLLEFRVMNPKDNPSWVKFFRFQRPIERLVSLFKALNIQSVEAASAQYEEVVDHFGDGNSRRRRFQADAA